MGDIQEIKKLNLNWRTVGTSIKHIHLILPIWEQAPTTLLLVEGFSE